MKPDEQKPYIHVDVFEELTGKIPEAAKAGIEEVGARIKVLREEKGLTLDELSKLTGFDVDLLEQIEKEEVQPQLGTVIKLSKALDSAFGRIVSGVGDKLYSITRKDERKVISRSTAQKGRKKLYTYMSLAPEVKGRNMEAVLVQLLENPEDEVSVHDGEEFIYVLEGVVRLKIGQDAFELEPGDSAYYLSTTPHVIAAKTGKATIIAVLYEG
jgi:transcriptional regulator with XRE-family HTH domain